MTSSVASFHSTWVLCLVSQDGSYLVRKSSGVDALQPYTLVVFYNGRVYNIPVRYIPSTKQYALGKQKNREEVKKKIAYVFFKFHNLLNVNLLFIMA